MPYFKTGSIVDVTSDNKKTVLYQHIKISDKYIKILDEKNIFNLCELLL